MASELVNIATELVKLIPSILWFLLVVILVLLFYRPIRDDLLPNLTSLKAGGVELSFIKDSIDAALELAQKSPQYPVSRVDSCESQNLTLQSVAPEGDRQSVCVVLRSPL